MISILALTMYRSELTQRVIEHNLANCGASYELLIADQGTSTVEPEFKSWLSQLNAKYLRLNQNNEGISRSLNQLILRASGDIMIFMPNDITLPERWGVYLEKYSEKIPNSGVMGFLGQGLALPEMTANGFTVYSNHKSASLENSQILGATAWTRAVVDKIGYFCEDYHPYGFEDADFVFRAKLAGFFNYLLPFKSEHLGVDENNDSQYHDIKTFMSLSNVGLHRWRAKNYDRIGLYVPPPIEMPANT